MSSTNGQRSRAARIVHVSLDTASYYRRRPFPGGFEGLFLGGDGTPLTAVEAAAFLVVERARGHVVIPASAQCGKACPHADSGCKGYDHSGGGCPGYFVDDA